MPHDTPLISTIAMGLGLAFGFGVLALRLPPILGYILAGVAVGPFPPGYVADADLAGELAEIGVIFLMFGVGLHFSLRDLGAVRRLAVPGALGQIVLATRMGAGLAWARGWSLQAGLVFGLCLSVASTVVLLRALQERGVLQTETGRVAVGWLVVEDLAMVLALVLLPSLGGEGLGWTLALTGAKLLAFAGVMAVLGRRGIPWVLHLAAHSGNRETFRLGGLAIALGVAHGAAVLFGVSFALGAFLAGMVLAESRLAAQAAKDILPLRDAFAVLFFVSVGMMFDPWAVWEDPLPILAVVAVITLGKALAGYGLVRVLGGGREVGRTVAAGLAQVGEFSFILVVLGRQLGLVPPEAQDLVVGGAIGSILLNPLAFALVDRTAGRGPAD